jgi:hypothetical protein
LFRISVGKNSTKMKKALSIALAILAATVIHSCKEEGRIDQIDEVTPAPAAPTVTSVENRPGGAIIRYNMPNDKNLLGVMVTYIRNGEECKSKASKYVDSLVVKGFGNTEPREVTLYSVGVNQKLSNGVKLIIHPEAPTVQTARFEISETFGGVSVHLSNNTMKDELAAVVIMSTMLEDSAKNASQIRWSDIHTFHTSSEDIKLYRRGLGTDRALYGVYLRDRFNNYSDTLFRALTPVEEIELPKSTFRNAVLPTDTYVGAEGSAAYELPSIWDGSVNQPHIFATPHQSPIPQWFTISLGYTAIISRLAMWPRLPLHELYSGGAPRIFEVYGSMDPNPDGSWDASWHLLGRFEQFKPSGYGEGNDVGTITDEDKDYFFNKTEYEFVPGDDYPDPYQEVKYLRFKVLATFGTYLTDATTGQLLIAELTLFGQKK